MSYTHSRKKQAVFVPFAKKDHYMDMSCSLKPDNFFFFSELTVFFLLHYLTHQLDLQHVFYLRYIQTFKCNLNSLTIIIIHRQNLAVFIFNEINCMIQRVQNEDFMYISVKFLQSKYFSFLIHLHKMFNVVAIKTSVD